MFNFPEWRGFIAIQSLSTKSQWTLDSSIFDNRTKFIIQFFREKDISNLPLLVLQRSLIWRALGMCKSAGVLCSLWCISSIFRGMRTNVLVLIQIESIWKLPRPPLIPSVLADFRSGWRRRQNSFLSCLLSRLPSVPTFACTPFESRSLRPNLKGSCFLRLKSHWKLLL